MYELYKANGVDESERYSMSRISSRKNWEVENRSVTRSTTIFTTAQ